MNNGALHGSRIVVTRAQRQAGGFSDQLKAVGATVILFPTIDVIAPQSPLSIDADESFDWVIFTSTNAVSFFAKGLEEVGRSISEFKDCRVCAVGPVTATAVRAHGLNVEAQPDEYLADAIAPVLGNIRDAKILLPRADIANPDLPTQLKACGAALTEVIVYCTVKSSRSPEETAELLRESPHLITFTSSSTARNFHEIVGGEAIAALRQSAVFASIGPKTTATAEALGTKIAIQPIQHHIPALVEAIVEWTQTHKKNDNEHS